MRERQSCLRFLKDLTTEVMPEWAILPAYYAASLNADQEQVIQHYVDICEGSPVRSVHEVPIGPG